tara:strand:+ start:6864 stop:7520 length:657 start_codon:yes stop_codon:yes gene_type:complete
MGNTNTESSNIPYVTGYGYIGKILKKIIDAPTPARFTVDFLTTKLGARSSSARPVIPFLKKIGFLNSDGTPTDLYKKFRTESTRSLATEKAMRRGFSVLYGMNEYVHDVSDAVLKDLVIQSTGLATGSKTVQVILGSFKELKKFSKFEGVEEEILAEEGIAEDVDVEDEEAVVPPKTPPIKQGHQIKLGYNINLNLPATTDSAVYNAIFKSLKDNLLD